MRLLTLLGLVMVLATSFLISITTTASAQQHCTASNPCQQICGDHVCAPGEYAQMQAAKSQAQGGNTASTAPVNMTSANMTNQSVGTIVAGVLSYMDIASDGTTVIIRTGHPIAGQSLSLGIAFYDANKNPIANQNYEITVAQGNSIVLYDPTGHATAGLDTLSTSLMPSSDPINIQLTLKGIGPSSADPSTWGGLKGEVLTFSQATPVKPANMTTTTPPTNVPPTTPPTNMTSTPTSNNAAVPEFGSLATSVLAIAVLSMIVFVVKTRVNLKIN